MQEQSEWTKSVWAAFRARLLTPAARDVLLRLASFRGRTGLIFPSHEAIGLRARCCTKTVKRGLDAAAGLGLLRWIERRVKVGPWATQRTSNLYELIPKNRPKPSTGQNVPVAPQDSFSLLTASPERSDAVAALARVNEERTKKFAQEWRDRRQGAGGGRQEAAREAAEGKSCP